MSVQSGFQIPVMDVNGEKKRPEVTKCHATFCHTFLSGFFDIFQDK